jgi:hypothetical protein
MTGSLKLWYLEAERQHSACDMIGSLILRCYEAVRKVMLCSSQHTAFHMIGSLKNGK